MDKIYKGQTALTIELTVGVDITNATALVKYKKPSKITGSWTATITDTINGVIKYDISNADDIDESGNWTFWADITFATGKWVPGEPIQVYIYKPGT